MATENRGAKAANAMFLYAGVMVAAGVVAYVLAPETANAGTALAVPAACGGVMVLCGLMSLAIGKQKVVGMIGIHLGLVLPLLFAGVIGMRAVKTGEAVDSYRQAESAWQATGAAGGEAARAAHFAALDAPDHDKSYLRNTLWFLTVASVAAFGGILSRRPPKEERTAPGASAA